MTQLYTENSSENAMKPKKETIQLLLNFSKSLRIIKPRSDVFIELNLN